VVLADIDQTALDERVAGFGKRYGADSVRAEFWSMSRARSPLTAASPTRWPSMAGSISSSPMPASRQSAPIEDTSLALWQKNMDVLATGYFLVSRAAFRLMKAQGSGRAMVFVASKNGLAASAGCLRLLRGQGGRDPPGPLPRPGGGATRHPRQRRQSRRRPARLQDLGRASGATERAKSYKVGEEELDEIYRQRSMLKLSVYPEDIAEAAYFLASDMASPSRPATSSMSTPATRCRSHGKDRAIPPLAPHPDPVLRASFSRQAGEGVRRRDLKQQGGNTMAEAVGIDAGLVRHTQSAPRGGARR
jgi:hypothetical protein